MSTLINVEGIDLLAGMRSLEAVKEVEALTTSAMCMPEGGRMAFSEIYLRRLEILNPRCEEVEKLGVRQWNAVLLEYAPDGSYAGVCKTPLLLDNGKTIIMREKRRAMPKELIVFIGDGVTDLRTRHAVDCFVAYTGVVERPNVVKAADASIHSLRQLLTDKTKVAIGRTTDYSAR